MNSVIVKRALIPDQLKSAGVVSSNMVWSNMPEMCHWTRGLPMSTIHGAKKRIYHIMRVTSTLQQYPFFTHSTKESSMWQSVGIMNETGWIKCSYLQLTVAVRRHVIRSASVYFDVSTLLTLPPVIVGSTRKRAYEQRKCWTSKDQSKNVRLECHDWMYPIKQVDWTKNAS